jgi:abhydrolase domain-containing protein 12
LILDGSAAVDWVLKTAGIPSSRVVLLGQSLGTAVTSGVAAQYAKQGVDFAGVILVAAFSSLPQMLPDYRIGGMLQVLGPLKVWPALLNQVMGSVIDTWKSDERVHDMAKVVKARKGRLNLNLVHAKDDTDIPCDQDDILFGAAVRGLQDLDPEELRLEKEKRTVVKGENSFVATWRDEDITIRQDLVPYGGELVIKFQEGNDNVLTVTGHNDIMSYAPVTQAVMRSFNLIGSN